MTPHIDKGRGHNQFEYEASARGAGQSPARSLQANAGTGRACDGGSGAREKSHKTLGFALELVLTSSDKCCMLCHTVMCYCCVVCLSRAVLGFFIVVAVIPYQLQHIYTYIYIHTYIYICIYRSIYTYIYDQVKTTVECLTDCLGSRIESGQHDRSTD